MKEKVCVMCGRNKSERPGEWTTLWVPDYPDAIRLCERDAPNFDPAASYDPIKAERLSAACPEVGTRAS